MMRLAPAAGRLTSRAAWRAGVLVAGVVAVASATLACSAPADSPSSAPATSGSRAATSAPTTTLGTDGARIFAAKCAGCHGSSGEGNLGPALVGIANRMTAAEQAAVVANGRGTMLAFSPALSEEQIAAVVEFTRTQLPRPSSSGG